MSCHVISSLALAGPSDYVISPIVDEGEREIDFKAGSAKLRDGERESKYSAGLGFGVNRWWFTEIYAIWHKGAGEQHGFDAWEWENKFQLTETGKYPLDIGLLFEIERPTDRSEGYEYRWGPLLQADLGYPWQVKYRWRPAFEFGLQGLGDVGPWNDWEPKSEQPHVAGPAVFGRLALGAHQTIIYNAGLLLALTDAAPRRTLRLQVEYEF